MRDCGSSTNLVSRVQDIDMDLILVADRDSRQTATRACFFGTLPWACILAWTCCVEVRPEGYILFGCHLAWAGTTQNPIETI